MNKDEKVIAVVDPIASAGESELANQVTDIETRAEYLVVTDDKQYEDAAEFVGLLRKKIAEVKDFFKPMKKAANDAHKQVCDREKQMLTPLEKAESYLKNAMGTYAQRKEQDRIEAEKEIRRLAQIESENKLREALEAERSGDGQAYEAAMVDAEITDMAARAATIESTTPRVKGVAHKKDWEIVSIDENKVPVSIAGVTIRPVDDKAVMSLIRTSKGKIKIEGIQYREVTKTIVRRS